MNQRERTAWALWASETWYTSWGARDVMLRLGVSKNNLLYYKTRGIVVFDRVLTERTSIDTIQTT